MKKRNVMILIMLLVVGFAAVSTTLILNGTIGIGANEDDFDVIFTSATINGEEATVNIDETKKKITFTSSKLTSVGEKAILDYKIKNNSTQYDADVTINCTNENSEYISVTNELAGEEITKDYKTTFTAQEEKRGMITAELIKSVTQESDSIEVTCTIVANATEREDAVEIEKCDIENPPVKELNAWKWTDNDCSGDITKGDLATIDTESFYVYDIEGDKVKAIAQYNLYVGGQHFGSIVIPLEDPTGLQDASSIGRVISYPYVGGLMFTTDEKYNSAISGMTENAPKQNDYSISTIKDYVDEYAVKLNIMDNYIQNVRLITKEELVNAGCDLDKLSCLLAPTYLYSTSYWTSSPDDWYDDSAWTVDSFGSFGSSGVNLDGEFGVRPVIEISKSLFE